MYTKCLYQCSVNTAMMLVSVIIAMCSSTESNLRKLEIAIDSNGNKPTLGCDCSLGPLYIKPRDQRRVNAVRTLAILVSLKAMETNGVAITSYDVYNPSQIESQNDNLVNVDYSRRTQSITLSPCSMFYDYLEHKFSFTGTRPSRRYL